MSNRQGMRIGAAGAAVLAALIMAGPAGAVSGASTAGARSLPAGPLYGLTIDDVSNVTQIAAAETALPARPTTRVYLDVKEPASYYSGAVADLDAHGYVMGEVLDSSDMTAITPAAEQARVSSLLSTLGPGVDIWEVGNEVNGNWTGPYRTGARMVTNTYNQVAAAGYRSALTLYYNSGCGDGPSELDPLTYSREYLPASVRDGLNYVLLSYYQTQCRNQVLSADTVTAYMQQLHQLYPNAHLGFGEIGLPNPVTSSTAATAASIISHYYSLPVDLPYYIGGYFYWYYDEDYTNPTVARALVSGFQAESTALAAAPPGPVPTSTTVGPGAPSGTSVPSPTTVPPATTTTIATTVAPMTTVARRPWRCRRPRRPPRPP